MSKRRAWTSADVKALRSLAGGERAQVRSAGLSSAVQAQCDSKRIPIILRR